MTSAYHSFEAFCDALYEQDTVRIIQTCRGLIKGGHDVNSCKSNGYTALMLAAENGYADCARALLEAGSDVNLSNVDRHTALMGAVENGYADCARVLLEAGADVNQSNCGEQTALIIAAWLGHVPCVQLLLEAGASVNDKDVRGHTALRYCLPDYDDITPELESTNAQKIKACLKLLINAGADIDIHNDMHLQPFHYALMIWPQFKFPAEYLISENCNLCQVSYDQIQTSIYREYFKEDYRLNILKLLFVCGLLRRLCESFIDGQEMSVRKWVNSVASQPHTLKSTCVFEIRRSLGYGIKSKVTKLNLPNVIQNLILLNGILSSECFI